jgi:hypothetical protein
MEIIRVLYVLALQVWLIFYLCNIFTLFMNPHKKYEFLIFLQIIWFFLGALIAKEITFVTGTEFTLMTYAYPIFLWLIQIMLACKFFKFYQQNKQVNYKFLFLSISQIISMILLTFIWIITLLSIATYIV